MSASVVMSSPVRGHQGFGGCICVTSQDRLIKAKRELQNVGCFSLLDLNFGICELVNTAYWRKYRDENDSC